MLESDLAIVLYKGTCLFLDLRFYARERKNRGDDDNVDDDENVVTMTDVKENNAYFLNDQNYLNPSVLICLELSTPEVSRK